MSGVTKHIFNQEVRDILSMWDCEIKTIEPLLPKEYSSGDIITLLKEFYPHEWHSVEIKYVYYQTKDRYIKRKFGKSRYHMKAPEVLLMDASRCKKILSKEYQRIHFDNYTEESGVLARENLWLKRKPKIERVNQKIEKALSKVQQVTPSFIDQLIGLYERKNTSQKDRRYILLELKKYYITLSEAIKMAAVVHATCNNQTISFSASDDGKWYDGYLNYCVKNRIVSSDEYSSLDAYATRAQIAHIFAKATSDFAVVNDIDYDYIPDVSERSEYADEILALYRAGILTGDERTRAFRPSDTITRAEAAAIISRVALPTTRIKIV